MTQNFNEVAKYLNLKIPEDKNNYLLAFRAYNTLDDSEVDKVRKKKDVDRFDKFINYDRNQEVNVLQ